MNLQSKKPPLVTAMLTNKCPSCRKATVFVHKSIFPFSELVLLKDECEVCGEKMKSERNNGGGINYALTVLLFFINLVWYWPIFGLSYTDNSVFYYLITSTLIVLIAQPWLMRLSRMIYLYLYIGFGHSRKIDEGVHIPDGYIKQQDAKA